MKLLMKLAAWLILLGAVLVPSPATNAQTSPPSPRAITVDDYFQIREVSDPQLSPDGQWVAYTVKTPLLKDDKNEERIWAVPISGGEPMPMSAEGVSSSHPRWSLDGKYLAFLSARNEGKTQV